VITKKPLSAIAARIAKKKRQLQRIDKIADKLLERSLVRIDKSKKTTRMVFQRTKTSAKPKKRRYIAYDFETSRIKAGTPRLLYLTAYNGDKENGQDFWFSGPVRNNKQLEKILVSRFLTEANDGVRFIAWNGNRFDIYFLLGALLDQSHDYTIAPAFTRNKTPRGVVVRKNGTKLEWEFLDGIAMAYQMSLKEFLKSFAPDHLKLDAPDWSQEEFDPKNKAHVEYAERDSIGLWHAMEKFRFVVREGFNVEPGPTIGNTAIKIFGHNIPHGIKIRQCRKKVDDIIRNVVMRGGYCDDAGRYVGPTWKYDLNQAYAAAMRETDMPAGGCIRIDYYSDIPKCAIWRVSGTKSDNPISFYYKNAETGKAEFAVSEISDTWITSIEYRQLQSEGWQLKVIDGYWWESQFRMTEYVDRLENLRGNAPGGPKSAQGVVIKAIGNNSYGKTVSELSGIEYVLAKSQPPGYMDSQSPDEVFHHIWFRFTEPQRRAFHQPQIGAFITAHVRMKVRAAALLDPTAWIYSDTDCVAFSREPKGLETDSLKYGAWKVENTGELFTFLGKKVYWSHDGTETKAKGLNVRFITADDKQRWQDFGIPPIQHQVHLNNLLGCAKGEEMYIDRIRRGTDFNKLKRVRR
jgi:hypothetical protein